MAWRDVFMTDGSLPYPAECRATLRGVGWHFLQTGRKTGVPAVFVLATCAHQLWRLTLTPAHRLLFHPLRLEPCSLTESCHYGVAMLSCRPFDV